MLKNVLSIVLGIALAFAPVTSLAGKGGGGRRDTVGMRTPSESRSEKSSAASERYKNEPVYKDDGVAAEAATALGYVKTNYRTNYKTTIFKKGNSYITRDKFGHIGGAWKEASSPEKLSRKETRNGTFDRNMKKIGK